MMTKQKKDDQCGRRRGWKEGRKGPRGVVGGGYNVPAPNGGAARKGETLSKRLSKDRATGTTSPGAHGHWRRRPRVRATHPERMRLRGGKKDGKEWPSK